MIDPDSNVYADKSNYFSKVSHSKLPGLKSLKVTFTYPETEPEVALLTRPTSENES